jgi:short-subunit dehydrogenase
MPKVMSVPASDVARAAVTGMDADRAVIIPGVANRIAAAAGWLSPRGVLVPMVAKRHPALGK